MKRFIYFFSQVSTPSTLVIVPQFDVFSSVHRFVTETGWIRSESKASFLLSHVQVFNVSRSQYIRHFNIKQSMNIDFFQSITYEICQRGPLIAISEKWQNQSGHSLLYHLVVHSF
jgi:hypothetical protein